MATHLDGRGGGGVSPGEQLAGDGGHGFCGMLAVDVAEMANTTPSQPYPRGVIPVARN